MKVICPACNDTGTLHEITYLGNNQNQCTFCNAILESKVQCPSCKSIVLAKNDISPFNPFGKFKIAADIIKSGLGKGDLILKCPECGHKGSELEFPLVFIYGNKKTINKRT